MYGVPLGRSCVLPLPPLDPNWQSSRPGPRPGPRSPEISTFYTIIKQWEFDHFGLLDAVSPAAAVVATITATATLVTAAAE